MSETGDEGRSKVAEGEPGGESAAPDVPRYARPTFLALTSLYWICLYLYVPILAPYVEFRGAGLSLVGLVVSAYGIAQLLLRIPVGLLSDRLGRRKPFLLAGFIASSLSCVGFILFGNPLWMVGARFVSGISACAWVAFTVLYASYYPPGQTTRAIGTITFCNTLSVMAATYAGGHLAEAFGWLAPFKVSAVLGVVGMVLALFVYETPKVRHVTRASLRSVVRYRELVIASIVTALGQYVTFATVFGFVPNYAVGLGASKMQLGLLTMLGTLASSCAILFGTRFLAPKIGPRMAVIGAYLLIGAATAAIPTIDSIGNLIVVQVIAGFGRGTAYPILMALAIARLPDSEKATAMGFFQAVYAIGMSAGPLVTGFIGEEMGYGTLFGSTAVVAWVTAVVALGLPKRQ